ncbi:DUF4393 domain-containing protein [Methylorubrum rhodesianum]|uniref:DUF4393 domain-containing protein n=1 Tax=Methylorubrum rhodesianum TaxID=29427 RepID=UPI003D2A22A7
MTTEHEMAIAIATEIGKQVPVKQTYEDAASPAMRQVGATFEDVVKCVRLVGFPIQWLAVQQDRFRSFIERAKEPIPEERRVLPVPQLLGPILEGIRYEVDETPISELFQNLLSSSMDRDKVNLVHPAFPALIRNLSSDEARILKHLVDEPITGLYLDSRSYPGHTHRTDLPDTVERWGESELYFEHLESLSLVQTVFSTDIDTFKFHPDGELVPFTIRITLLGRRLMMACQRST